MSWRRGYYDYDYFPPPSRPRAAKGGIKAQSKRGTFGESWWAKRWIAVLERQRPNWPLPPDCAALMPSMPRWPSTSPFRWSRGTRRLGRGQVPC